ncbi:MAG: Flp pilus assembly complex ATPase component TadA [Chloroflexota bacterium]|nr:Flp pilus assembly complex ATPase component TadA [Chloroflexota bacterium]MDE3194138.1 Flp pilus assembly complex ATPase component TadA [Chloroflexota bacterium]
MASPARARLGDLLVRAGIITPEQADAAAAVHRANGRTIGQQLLADGAVTELDLTAALSYQLDIPLIRIASFPVDDVAVYLTPRDLAGADRLLVVGSRDDALLVAMADPGDAAVRDALAERTGRRVIPLVAVASELERELERRGFALTPQAEHGPAPRRVVPEARAEPVPHPAPPPTPASAAGELVPFPRAGARPRPVEEALPETEEPRDAEAPTRAAEPEPDREPAPETEPEPQIRSVGFARLRAEPGPESQIVRFVLAQAIREHASDIHIEPLADRLRVRSRVDGVLREVTQLPREMAAAVATRLRSLAGMSPTDRQGRLVVRDDTREATFDVTAVPTVSGEKIVLRVAERTSAAPELDDLGMESGILERWRELLRVPYGLLLVAGMPGMGKTTTLYASARELPSATKDVTTVEDPVAFALDGVSQVQVDRASGASFVDTLRGVLAQEPDVVIVGELRERDTAEVTMNAALAGRLALSTIQSPDSVAALYRVSGFGADPYLVSASVVAVLAQILLPRLCEQCRVAAQPSMLEAALLRQAGLNAERVFTARGCARCGGTGRRGRVAAFELLIPTEELRSAIERGAKIEDARDIAARAGLVGLREAALRLAADGVATVQDVIARLPASGA